MRGHYPPLFKAHLTSQYKCLHNTKIYVVNSSWTALVVFWEYEETVKCYNLVLSTLVMADMVSALSYKWIFKKIS